MSPVRGNRLPATGAGFVWETEPFPVLRPQSSSFDAVYTTRLGGASGGDFASLNLSFVVGDDDETVRSNRTFAAGHVGADRWAATRQVHGADIHRAQNGALRDGDALWTDDPAQTVGVLSADCVLLAVAGPRGLAVVHAGWRGLVAGAVERAIAQVGATEVFAGPAIGPCCFEVGAEVVGTFARRFPASVTDDRHVDLWVAAEAASGDVRFAAARMCTSCHEELFFSHRRDRGRTGRQGLIARPR